MEIESEYFENLSDIINEKNSLVRMDSDRRDREKITRLFYNGQPTMTEEEAEEAGRSEITNHLMGYKAMSRIESKIYQIYAAPGDVLKIKVDTDRPEVDIIWSQEMSADISEAIRESNEYSFIWRSLSGEITLTGRSPLMHESDKGWCPEFVPHVLIPKGTPSVSKLIPYAFVPKEMTLADLTRLKNASTKKGGLIDGEAVDELIVLLNDQIEGNNKTPAANDARGGFQIGSSVTDDTVTTDVNKTTVDVWWFYEPELNGGPVRATLFAESIVGSEEGETLDSRVIAVIPKAISSPDAWIQLMTLDSEIGGVKTFETTKGIAEISYGSDLDTEEMFNVMIEADKAGALPRFQEEEGADPNDILDWDPNQDSMVPKSIREFRLQGNGGRLMTPIGMLMNNSAGITADSHSNVGQDQQLRVQALQSQQNAAESEEMRLSDVYMLADPLHRDIVDRFCNSTTSKGDPGHDDIMWFRARMDRKGIPYKELATKTHGRFDHMKVKCRRLSGGGIADRQMGSAQFMMQNITSFPPESRPLILQTSVATITGDVDLAREVVELPNLVMNDQKTTAENEFDTIYRRASLGKTLPINKEDIDQDHIPVHLIDMEAKIMAHQYEPWTILDAEGFRLITEHVSLHIERMVGNPASNKEAEEFIERSTALAAAGDKIIGEVQQQAAEEQAAAEGPEPMSQKEMADVELKARDQQLKEQQFGAKLQDQQGVEEQRQSRTEIAERNQILKEGLAGEKVAKERRDEFREIQDRRNPNKDS